MGWMDDVTGYKVTGTPPAASDASGQGFMANVSNKPPPPPPPAPAEAKPETKASDYENVPWTGDNSVYSKMKESAWPDVKKVWSDTVHGIVHPIESLEGMRQIASGGFSTGMEKLGIPPGFGIKTPTPEDLDKIEREKAVFKEAMPGEDWYKQPVNKLKQEISERPAQLTMNASLPLTGAEKALTAAGLEKPAQIAGTLSKANPVGVPMGVASSVAKNVVAPVLNVGASKLLGQPEGSFKQAYQAGEEGSFPYLKAYLNPLSSGDNAIHKLAKSALDKIYGERQADWLKGQENLRSISEAGQRVDYTPMIDRISQEVQTKFDPRTGANNFSPKQLELMDEMANSIHERSLRDPAQYDLAHTAIDLDQYKRLFTDAFEDKARNAGMSHVYNDIRKNIVDQIKNISPKYADDMANYGAQTDEINSILKQFKLGSKADKDAAIERLMSKNANKASHLDTLAEYEPELKNVIAGRQLKVAQAPKIGPLSAIWNPLDLGAMGQAIFSYPGLYGGLGYGAGAGMNTARRYVMPAIYEGDKAEGRQGRASGGKVDHKSAEALSDQLVAAFARAKKDEELETKVLLNKPDEMIIDALKEAKKAI